jgi:hypothetical protein
MRGSRCCSRSRCCGSTPRSEFDCARTLESTHSLLAPAAPAGGGAGGPCPCAGQSLCNTGWALTTCGRPPRGRRAQWPVKRGQTGRKDAGMARARAHTGKRSEALGGALDLLTLHQAARAWQGATRKRRPLPAGGAARARAGGAAALAVCPGSSSPLRRRRRSQQAQLEPLRCSWCRRRGRCARPVDEGDEVGAGRGRGLRWGRQLQDPQALVALPTPSTRPPRGP